ncbi:hypothetical protein E2C01_075177 [Portunus trituberculatus]|uniref:Uncharacterized protein n=1 Tax=Portunus trituberculatus TaxID=210409 RepID=A0A5B7IJC9_PORTR|nr:hypothetical protein [Portunus trituberculatus]
MYHISTWLSILSIVESRVQVVLLARKEDTVSPAFLIESADLKIVETVNGGKMVTSNAIVFLPLVSMNNIQLHFENLLAPVPLFLSISLAYFPPTPLLPFSPSLFLPPVDILDIVAALPSLLNSHYVDAPTSPLRVAIGV